MPGKHAANCDQVVIFIFSPVCANPSMVYIFKSIVIYTNVYKALTEKCSVKCTWFPKGKFLNVCLNDLFRNVSLTQARSCLRGHKNYILILCPVHDFLQCVFSFSHHHRQFYHI